MDVSVTVFPDKGKSTDGEIDTSMSWADIRDDIVESLDLGGEPDQWSIAVSPRDLSVAPATYRLTEGDTLVLIKRTLTRSPAFKPRPKVIP